MVARTVALKLRFADFSTITRSRTVQTPVDSAQLIYAVALQLLESVGTRPMTVGWWGSGRNSLRMPPRTSLQLSIDRRDDNWRAAEQALDQVTRKFGNKSVLPARSDGTGNAGGEPGKLTVPGAAGSESHCRLSDQAPTNYPYIYIVFE